MRASVLQNGCNTSGKQSSPTTTPVLRYVSTRRQGGRRGADRVRLSRVRNFSARIVARSFHNACRAACNAPRDAAGLPPSPFLAVRSTRTPGKRGGGKKGRRRAQPCERTRRGKGKGGEEEERGIRVFRYVIVI